MSISTEQYWSVADQISNASSVPERLLLIKAFTGNPTLLSQFCRAIKISGSRSAVEPSAVKALESQVR